MGRERQKKKNRSSVSKVRAKQHDRTKSGRKKVNFLGNETIAKNWDRKLTLQQNYKRLGLSSRLGGLTGGVEKLGVDINGKEKEDAKRRGNGDLLAMTNGRTRRNTRPEEVRVQRDPETGHIIAIVRSEELENENPLNDPLNEPMDLEDEENITHRTGVVAELEAEALAEEENLARKKRPRQQSQREEEWLATLFEKYGDNTLAMSRDRKLSPMQQSEGDLKRRLRKWKETRQTTT